MIESDRFFVKKLWGHTDRRRDSIDRRRNGSFTRKLSSENDLAALESELKEVNLIF